MPLNKINIERTWSVMLGGLAYRRSRYDFYERLFQLSPAYSEADVTAIDEGSALSLPALLPVMASFDYSNVTKFECPIILFEGRRVQDAPPYAKPAAQ